MLKFNVMAVGFIAVFGILTCAGAPALGALVVDETFDYSPGALGTQGGWSRRNGDASTSQVVAGSLEFGSIVNGGNKLQLGDTEAQGLWIPSGTIDWDSNSTTYIGMLIQASGVESSGGGRFMNVAFSSATIVNRGLTGLYNMGRVGIDNFVGNAFSSNDVYPGNVTGFLLVEVNTVNAGNDSIKVSLYLTPDGNGGILNATPAATATAFSVRDSTTDHLQFRFGANVSTPYIDALRVGSSIADVAPIPEPASGALMFCGLLGWTALRRRQSH